MVCPRVWCCSGICLQKVGKSTKYFDLQITWPKLELSNDRTVSEYRHKAKNVAFRFLCFYLKRNSVP